MFQCKISKRNCDLQFLFFVGISIWGQVKRTYKKNFQKPLDKSERMFYNVITRNRTLVRKAILSRVQHKLLVLLFLNQGANHDSTHQ